jgi:PHP family Zn ribbon phosphoesterase
MHRVDELADRPPGFVPHQAIPAIHLVPLEEIIAEALGHGRETEAVQREYARMVKKWSEFDILLECSPGELAEYTLPRVLEGIIRVRDGQVHIMPGYDGEYGKIRIFTSEEDKEGRENKHQLSLFGD